MTGQVIVRGPDIPVQVQAYLSGRVVDIIPNEGVVVENEVTFVQGIFGIGGETYAIGGEAERTNLDVVEAVCDLVDQELGPRSEGSRRSLIEFVTDRPGHDLRYAIDPAKARRDLGWSPSIDFETGLARTVRWYIDNDWWWRPLLADRYDGGRLGTVINL